MHDGKKPKTKTSDPASTPQTGTATPVPLCRYEELALRENRLRQAGSRRDKK